MGDKEALARLLGFFCTWFAAGCGGGLCSTGLMELTSLTCLHISSDVLFFGFANLDFFNCLYIELLKQ
jgi:hypothetical protein